MKDPLTKTVVVNNKAYKYIDESIREKFSEFIDCLPKTVSYGKEEYCLNIWQSGGYHISYRNKKYKTAPLSQNLVNKNVWGGVSGSRVFPHGNDWERTWNKTYHLHFYNGDCDMESLCGFVYNVILRVKIGNKSFTHSEMVKPYSKKREKELLEKQKLQLEESLKNIEKQLS